MRGLVPYAWRGLVARPARSLLTVLGIAVGVAVLVAALAVNAGLDASIDRAVASLAGRADLRVAAFTERGLSDATLVALDDAPGVALTAPAIERRSFLGPTPGRPVGTEPVTVLGIDPAREPRVRDLVLARGEALAGEVAEGALVTERLAAAEGLDLGSELAILGAGAPVRVVVTGILAGDGPSLGSSGRTVVVPIATAHRLLLADGEAAADHSLHGITRVDVVVAPGVAVDDVVAGIQAALVAEPYVLTLPRDTAASMRASTADIRATMALLASVALFAAAFLVLNAASMTVQDRIRELGLLRAAGARRGQLVRVVETQALVLGVAGGLAGLGLGTALALVVTAWLRATGTTLDAPEMSATALLAGLGAAIGISLVAALEPARRAAAVSPVTALRARSEPAAAARPRAGWLVAVIAVAGLAAGLALPAGSATPIGPLRTAAVYALLLLGVLLTPLLLGPLGRVAGLPFALGLRLEERLARASLARDTARTTVTVGALVVGLAMVVALGAVAGNARAAATAWLVDVVPGDEILTAIAPVPLREGGADEELATIPGVARATPLASFDLAVGGTRVEATAVRGGDLAADGRLRFVAGDRDAALAALDEGGAVVLPRDRAGTLGAGVGDVVAVTGADGPVGLRVAGIVERSFPARTGDTVLVGWSDATGAFGVQGADAFAVRYAVDGPADARARVADLAMAYALAVAPVSRVEGAIGDALDRVFGLFDLLALAAVVIAALGIANTLSMGTWERTRELGMLRAAGMSRGQVWRSVLVEAGILGLVGSVAGGAVGAAVGALLVVTAAGRTDLPFRVPWPTLVLAVVAGVAVAMLAAAQPARIAGRRSIVGAVRGE